jgi:S1-C subfamily serine protease
MPAPKLGVLGISANESGVKGVKISSFSDESCDASKKLKAGDIIVSIGERKISSYYDVTDEIGKHLVGDSVLVTVYRSGQYLSFDVELTE